jgi:hypothetical protein
MKQLLQILSFVCALAATSAPVWATAVLMDALPTSDRFRCLNCHTIQDPSTTQAELNPFGVAFRANSSRWDEQLARLRSDGDNCTNGFELGDVDGDGKLDDNVAQERSNPGEAGCTLQLDEATWGALKKLFR